MNESTQLFISIWIKLFFLLTPFFVMSVFLSLTQDLSAAGRRKVAAWLTVDVIFICFVLYFLGNAIFSVLGITLDAFRIGAGALLFLFGCRSCEGEWNLAATGRVRKYHCSSIGYTYNRRPGNNRCAPRYGHRGCLSVGKDRGMCSSFQCSNIHQYPSFSCPLDRESHRTYRD